jgi:hypothetical protein
MVMRIGALAENTLILGIIPTGIEQPVGGVEMFLAVNRH